MNAGTFQDSSGCIIDRFLGTVVGFNPAIGRKINRDCAPATIKRKRKPRRAKTVSMRLKLAA